MRLIDADKIDFGKVFIGASDFAKDTREAAQKLIDEQPAAYDVDKVVEQLEEEEEEAWKYWNRFDDESAFGRMTAYSNAVEIVKSGGIEKKKRTGKDFPEKRKGEYI